MKQLIPIAAAAFLAAAACKQDSSTTGEPAQEAMGLYAKGFNALIGDPKKLVSEYFDEIPDDGPKPGEKINLFPRQTHATSELKEARDAFAAAKKAAPASLKDLGPHADAAIAAMDKIIATYTAAQTYYAAENYKDDQLAKGKELHAQMVAAAGEFRTALGKLEAGLSTVEDQQAVTELKKYAGAKSYSYWFRFYNMEAKKFLTAVERAESPEQLAQLEPAAVTIKTAHDELAKFVADKGAAINNAFNSYASAAGQYQATSTKLARMAKDPATKEDVLGREVDMLVSQYNTLVSLANSMYQLEAANALK